MATAQHVHSELSGSLRQVLVHRLAQLGQPLREPHELVELRLLLARAEFRVVEVLPAAGAVDAGGLQLRAGARRDPDVLPGRRNGERLDPLERSVVVIARLRGRSSGTAAFRAVSILPSVIELRSSRPAAVLIRRDGGHDDRRPRGRRDRAGAARGGATRARAGRHRARARASALRPLAGESPGDARTASSTRRPRRSASTGWG